MIHWFESPFLFYSMKIFNKNTEIHFSPYGASIQKWIIYNSQIGELDIVLGLDNSKQYKGTHPCFGSIVGRYANRINNSKFNLNGITYNLIPNEGKNHLHSGKFNFAFKKWEYISHGNLSCSFILYSKHLEGNYPGDLSIKVTYSLIGDCQLDISYKAESSHDTIINLTNHTYFNLNGHNGSNILNHHLHVNADHFTPVNEQLLPSGVIQSVKNTPFDFNLKKQLNSLDFTKHPFLYSKGIDHNYVLKNKGKYSKAASVFSDISGLKLECFTDQPGLQIYLANTLNHFDGKDNCKYDSYQGLCLEAQAFPDSPNNAHFPSVILKKDDIYKQLTSYKISNK